MDIHTQEKLISQWHHEKDPRVAGDLLQKKDFKTQSGKINKSRKSRNGGAGC